MSDTSRTLPLNIVITSATINPEKFLNFFSDFTTSVLTIPGKTYPVKTIWSSMPMELENDYVKYTVDKVEEIILKGGTDMGGLLVFLAEAGQAERAQKIMEENKSKACQLVKFYQLHGRVLLEDQEEVFRHSDGEKRQVIFATAVAETSITVPNITVVVDSGVGKEQRFDPVKNITSVVLGKISQSSAVQRSGRAGRTSAGTCYRLYSKSDFDTFEHGTVPEIKRLPLEQCLLRLLALGVADPLQFDFMDKPDLVALEKALNSLCELGAVDGHCKLTALGRDMSAFSFDPRLSKLLVECFRNTRQLLYEVMIICAMVSSGGHIFFRAGTAEEKNRADTKKLRFCHTESDFITMLNVFLEWSVQPGDEGKRKWCKDNAIHHKSMRNIIWRLKDIMKTLSFRFRVPVEALIGKPAGPDAIPKLISLVNSCFKQTLAVFSGHADVGYILLNGLDVFPIHPGSSVAQDDQDMPQFIVYGQILTTYASFCQHVSRVPDSDPLAKEAKAKMDNSEEAKSLSVSPLCYQAAGGRILKRCFLGEKGIRKKELVEDLEKKLTKIGANVFGIRNRKWPVKVRVNWADGQIIVICHEKFHSAVSGVLEAKVAAAVAESGFKKRTATHKIPGGNSSSSPELIIGLGGAVLEPLLIGDFKSVMVKKPPSDLQELTAAVLLVDPEISLVSKDDLLMLHGPRLRWPRSATRRCRNVLSVRE